MEIYQLITLTFILVFTIVAMIVLSAMGFGFVKKS